MGRAARFARGANSLLFDIHKRMNKKVKIAPFFNSSNINKKTQVKRSALMLSVALDPPFLCIQWGVPLVHFPKNNAQKMIKQNAEKLQI